MPYKTSQLATQAGCVVQNLLTFVAVRLFLPKGATRLPRPVANALYQIVAMVAQQFEGYIFTVNIDEVSILYRFDSAS